MLPDDAAAVWTGEQRLACALLWQAVTDLRSPSASVRAASRAFFLDTPALRDFWGEVLGIEDGVARYAARLAQAMTP